MNLFHKFTGVKMLLVFWLFSMSAMADDDYLMLSKCRGAEETWPYGSYTAGTLEAASQFDEAELKDYIGGRITKIRFFAAWTYYYDWFDLWVKNKYDDEVRLAEVRTTEITDALFKWHYYELPEPVEITGEPLALGATFNCTDMTFPLACCIQDTPGGLYMKQPDGEWADFSTYYDLCIEAVVEGVKIMGSSAEVNDMSLSSHYFTPGEKSEVTIRLLNTGKDFSSVTLERKCGTNTSKKTFAEAVSHGTYYTTKMNFTAPKDVDANAKLSVAVTAIDGEPYEGEPMEISFGVFDNAYDRNVVIEEATNSNNGYCVRGVVARDYMNEKYPDSFIGIAIHSNSDPMGIRSYMSGDLGISSVPGCTVDRMPVYRDESVSSEFYENYYNAERKRKTYADFALTAAIDDDNIVGKAVASFGYDNPTSALRMVYVVLEDGVTGFTMANSYSGGGNGEMDGFEWLPSVIDFLPFDNVARAIYPSQFGEDGTLPTAFAKDEECRHEFSYAMPDNIQDRNNLWLVGMMIDGRSGEIVQAHKVHLDNADAIEGISADAAEGTWYNLNGQLIGAPNKAGLYIKNGKKVIFN